MCLEWCTLHSIQIWPVFYYLIVLLCAVDVYSFAMIFYYLLSGIPPLFESNAVKAAQLAALHGIRPSWPAKNRCEEPLFFRAHLFVNCWIHLLSVCVWPLSVVVSFTRILEMT